MFVQEIKASIKQNDKYKNLFKNSKIIILDGNQDFVVNDDIFTHADLSYADLSGINLSGANLR